MNHSPALVLKRQKIYYSIDMNFNRPSAENPEYKEVKKEDVIELATQALVDETLNGAGQDFIERRRPHLVADTRAKVEKIYEDHKDMFENFSGDVSGDSADRMVGRRAEVLTNLFEQSEGVDLSAGRDAYEVGGFSEAISEDGFASAYVMGSEGANETDKIENFEGKVKNAKMLISLFKNQDKFGHSKFQEALASSDLDAALAEFRNFQEKQLGEGKEEKVV